MHFKIYPDVIFIVNLLMDYILLSVWARLVSVTTTYFRIVLAAALGAAWSLMIACMPGIPNILENFGTYFGVGLLMIYIVGRFKTIKQYVNGLISLYVINVFMAGLINLVCRNSISTLRILCCCIIGYQLAVPLTRLVKKYVIRQNVLYRITLTEGERSICINALYDTGCSLSDPYTGEPVNVVERQLIDEIIPTDKIFSLIPFKSLGRDNGMMKLIKIDKLFVEYNNKILEIDNPRLAIYEGSLSADKEYGAILNSRIFIKK